MPNPSQLVETPMGGGLQQRTAEAHIPFGELTIAKNVRQNKNGMVEKRPGNTHLTSQYQTLYNIGAASLDVSKGAALSAYGSELLISCNAGTACYSDAYGTFATMRPGSEALVKRSGAPLPSVILADVLTGYSMEPAFCTDGTNYYYVFVDSSENLWATIQNISTGAIVQDRIAIDSGAGNILWAVPLIVGTQFTVVYLNSSGAIKMVGMASPYTGAFTVSATLVASGAGIVPNIDAVVVGANFAVAYAISTTGITIKTFNAAGSNLATASTITAANVLEIRLSYEGINNLWLGYRLSAGNLFVAGFNSGTLGIHYSGAFSVVASGVSSFHLVTYAMNVVLIAATINTTYAAVYGYLVDFTSGSGVISIAGAADASPQSFVASKPFLQDGRSYVWSQTWSYAGNAPLANEWGVTTQTQWTNVLLDLRTDTGTTGTGRPSRPVAADSPRFAFPKPSNIVTDTGANVGQKVAPLSLVTPATNKWGALFGVRETAYISAWARLDVDFASTARWSSKTLGNLLLRGSGLVTNWTGSREIENGFLHHVAVPILTPTTGGAITVSHTYYYKVVPMAIDEQGNVHRGIPSTALAVALDGTHNAVTVQIPCYGPTDRSYQDGSTVAFTYSTYYEIYRSAADQGSSGTDIATNFVGVVKNSPGGTTVTYTDISANGSVAKNALCYTFGGNLPNGCPPGALDLCVHQGRAWTIDDTGTVLYFTKQIVDGEAVNFTDSFTLPVDDQALALASMDDKLVVFTKRAIYYVIGVGPNDNGTGQQYDVPQRVQSPVGCIDRRSVVTTPDGVMFQSAIGIYLLDRGLNVVYIGQPVSDEITTYPVVVSANLHQTQPWIYFYVTKADSSAGERIVYDYRVQKWYTDTLSAVPLSATSTSDGAHYWLDTTGQVWKEDATTNLDNSVWVTMDVELAPQRAAGVDGWQNLSRMQLLFYNATPCDLTIQTRSGYATSYDSPSDAFSSTQIAAMQNFNLGTGVSAVEITPASSKLNGVSVRITDATPSGGEAVGTGQGAKIFALAFETEDLKALANVDDSQRGTGS